MEDKINAKKIAFNKIEVQKISLIKRLFKLMRNRLLKDEYIDALSELELEILNDTNIDAFVAPVNNKKVIFISIGLIRSVWNLLLLTLCDPKSFPGYNNEKKVPYKCPRLVTKLQLLQPAVTPLLNGFEGTGNKATAVGQSITVARNELCDEIFRLIFDYILHHEAMHITRDHLSLFKILNNTTVLKEKENLKGKAVNIYQLLETDADSLALSYSLLTHPEYSKNDTISTFRKEDLFFWLIFSHILLQQIFDIDHEDMKYQLISDYPPPVFRSLVWSNLLRQHFRQSQIITEEAILNQQNKAWYEASRVAKKMGFPDGRWSGNNMNDIQFDVFNKFIGQYNDFAEMINDDNESENNSVFKAFLKNYKKRTV